jgi:membrane protease YdiL (CAAX protease family)
VAGIVFGWLYWRRGLEMAMLGHFCADLVLHVATPLIGLVRP